MKTHFVQAEQEADCVGAERTTQGLQFPYQYLAHKIYLDWAGRRWRRMPEPELPEPVEEPEVLEPETVFAAWVKELKDAGDRERLVEIGCDIGSALRACPGRPGLRAP